MPHKVVCQLVGRRTASRAKFQSIYRIRTTKKRILTSRRFPHYAHERRPSAAAACMMKEAPPALKFAEALGRTPHCRTASQLTPKYNSR